jgi:predicted nucleotidyltransferase
MTDTIKLRNCSPSDLEELLPQNVILLGYRGSIAHGMYMDPMRPEGIDDKDIMGVCIAPQSVYYGLDNLEQKERKLREWDSVVYELRKFVKLLEGSNPNVLSLLWLQENHYIYVDVYGERLINNRELFVSKKIYHSFTGYAYAQLKKMTHLAFEGYMGQKRKSLVEKFGYDTKNAAHCIRLLRMGIEFLKEGELHVHREDAPQLMEIKLGGWTLEQVQKEAEYLFKRAEAAYDSCTLPKAPDHDKINALVVGMLREWFILADLKESFNLDSKSCHADKDGDCDWVGCPQNRDGEPMKTGRHCPLDKGPDPEA